MVRPDEGGTGSWHFRTGSPTCSTSPSSAESASRRLPRAPTSSAISSNFEEWPVTRIHATDTATPLCVPTQKNDRVYHG